MHGSRGRGLYFPIKTSGRGLDNGQGRGWWMEQACRRRPEKRSEPRPVASVGDRSRSGRSVAFTRTARCGRWLVSPEIHTRIVRGALAATLGAMLAAACPAAAQMRVVSGTYVGDGNANHAIVGAGFQPDLVLIKGRSATSTI